ncbi:MAG TPA: type II toxin-antitoxin system HicB family antitoxin [Tepidisphaeraceae bacterium]|jgi:predicted RNase H-like HicB family nuclease|nr:type II toxin-antitoxin system HicB family antitoxin [Tepidisphaeraceae bacterium]
MRYAVIIEKAAKNYSAYVPDLPGCIATGRTAQETLNNLRGAMWMHVEGLSEDGEPIPDPTSLVDYLELEVSDIIAPRGQRRFGKVG